MGWGEQGGATELLGSHFELTFESGISYGYFDSTEDLWRFYARTFGPIREIVESNDGAVIEELSRRFQEEHEQFSGELGLKIPRPYLLVKGVRT